MPIRDYECEQCSLAFDDVLLSSGETFSCIVCGKPLTAKVSFAANYTISGDNSASCRPNKSKSTEGK